MNEYMPFISGVIMADGINNGQVEAVEGPKNQGRPTVSVRFGPISVLMTYAQADKLSRELEHLCEAVTHA